MRAMSPGGIFSRTLSCRAIRLVLGERVDSIDCLCHLVLGLFGAVEWFVDDVLDSAVKSRPSSLPQQRMNTFARVLFLLSARNHRMTVSELSLNGDVREPVTRRVHNRPWTADLESPRHAKDRQLVVEEAVDAVEQTNARYVNLVTHEAHGHPLTYLYDGFDALDGITLTYCGRCECGGYITCVKLQDVSSDL